MSALRHRQRLRRAGRQRRLIAWEIFNRPNKGGINGDGRLLDARVLNGDLTSEHTGELMEGAAERFGFGPSAGAWLVRRTWTAFKSTGEFPFARLAFASRSFPALWR